MPSKPPERLGLDFGCEIEHALGADAVTASNLLCGSQPFSAFR